MGFVVWGGYRYSRSSNYYSHFSFSYLCSTVAPWERDQDIRKEIDAMARELDERVQRNKKDREARHEELKRGGRSKNKQIDITPEEIHTKTDEELIAIFHHNQKEKHSHLDQQYEKVLMKMKKHRISDQEMQMLEMRREALDKKKEKIERQNQTNAQKFVDKMRRRAAHVKPASDEL